MADESDVEQSLKTLIVGYLYPNGTSQPCAAGVPVQVFRGWPTTQQFTAAKNASLAGNPGLVLVSVCTRQGVERNTTRYPLTWQTVIPPTHSLTATLGGANNNQITIGGTVAVPQNVIAIFGDGVGAQAFVYAVQSSDTLNTIAAGLAALIDESYSGTTSSGHVVTVNTGLPITVRVASSGTVLQEVGRQDKEFQITIWAPPCNVSGQDADSWRNAVAKIINPPLRQLNRIAMIDSVWARIRFERTITNDQAQMQGLYRRDLFYFVEYATTVTQTAYEIGVAVSKTTDGASPTGKLPLPTSTPSLQTDS